MIHITDHAYERIRERVGIPRRSAKRHIKLVLTRGARLTTKETASQHHIPVDPDNIYFRHGRFIYVCNLSCGTIRIITVLNSSFIGKSLCPLRPQHRSPRTPPRRASRFP
jgi:hypothetical protein